MNEPEKLTYSQLNTLTKDLKSTLESMYHVEVLNDCISTENVLIPFRVSRYNHPTNYSYNQNILYVNALKVKDITLLNIYIKKAVQHLKYLPF